MRPYAEQNRNINGHVWQNMSHHQERGQPMYYQPNHGELQVMNYQRQVCTHGSGNLYSSNKEPSIRGQDQGETNGPVLGGRLMQSQKKEPAVTQHFQPKHSMLVRMPSSIPIVYIGSKLISRVPVKQSIIPQPTSPISTAWDNPFPTFPSSRSKPKVMENKTLSDDLAEMRLDGPTGKPHLPHDCDNQNQGTSRSHEFEQYRVEASPGAHDYRARGSEAQQQGRAEFERTIPALTQHSVQTLHSRSAYDVRSAAQASRDERPQYLPSQNNIGYSAPPLPSDGASTTGSQRSMTLPGQSTAPRSKFEHHQRYPGATGWQEPGPTGAYHGSRSQSIIPQRPATSMELRVADGVHPPSDEMNRSSNSGAEGIAMPDYGMVHPRKYSLDDFFDSYSGAPPQDPIQQPNNHERWLSVEAEMPDFDVAPVTWAAESRDIAFAQPVQPHGSAPTVPFTHPSVLESAGVDEALYVPESDSQSKFQPGHQTENQSSPDSRAGFIFELAGDIPVVPQRVQDSLHGRAANHYETNGNVMSKEQYILRSSQHNERAMRPGIPAHGTVGSFNGRPEDDWQRRFHHHRASPRAPKFEISGPGPDYEHRTIQPQSLPSPINRLVSAHSPISRPANPNALSEHPTPVRPGLMQGILGNQIPKPPPVRQYDSNVTPTQQQGPTQQATSARNLQKKALPAPVTVDELERLKQVVKVNPKDHKTQLILAKKLAEAAAVLADEGGRADPKTRNKNREKYVFDAHKIIKRLVSSGNSDAMFYLADCHGRGLLGLEIDDKEAFTLYQSAAKAGHAQSAYRVAVCCEMGQEGGGGTRRDPLKAMQWYKRAAMLGDTPAMYKMGMILLKGHLGQPRNSREAIVWLKRAADRADEENPHALHELVNLASRA